MFRVLATIWIPLLAILAWPDVHRVCSDDSVNGMRLRFSFGGSEPAVWKGHMEFPDAIKPSGIRILGMQTDHVGRIYQKGNLLVFDLENPATYGGVEFEVTGVKSTQLKYNFSIKNAAAGEQSLSGSVKLEELISKPHGQQIPESTNRVFISRAPGDDLKFLTGKHSLVYSTKEPIQFKVAVSPFCELEKNGQLNLDLSIHQESDKNKIGWRSSKPAIEFGEGFPFEVDSPLEPGVYNLVAQLSEPSSIPFSSPTILKQRTIQFVVVGDRPIKPFSDSEENFTLVYESEAGKQETFKRSRFKSLEKLNLSAKKLLRNLPLSTGKNGQGSISINPESMHLQAIAVAEKQKLHKLEIEYDYEGGTDFDLVIFDRESPQQKYEPVATATISHRDSGDQTKSARYPLMFWPRSAEPLLMLRNLKSTSPLKLLRIKAFQFDSKVEEFKLYTNRNRKIYTQFSARDFSRLLAAPRKLEQAHYSLDDWRTFQTGGSRLIRLVKSAEYQGVVIDVNGNSSGLYPSRLMHFSPAFDTGVFAESGRDPVRKDILELLFRQFTNNGLTLIPRLEIPEMVSAFEAADANFQPNLRLAKADGTVSSTYNYLNPHVESYLNQIALELVHRYSHHPSFGGICLRIGQNRQLMIPEGFGFNEGLVDRFLAENPDPSLKDAPLAKKSEHIQQQSMEKFRKWQVEQTTRVLKELNEKIAAKCEKSLMLDFSALYGPETATSVTPGLRTVEPKYTPKAHAFDLEELAKAGIGLLDTQINFASFNLADKRLEFALDSHARSVESQNQIHNMVRRTIRRREIANSTAESTPLENVVYESSIANSNYEFRRQLIRSVAHNDVLLYLDDFQLGHRALQSSSRRIWNTFSNLPNTIFETVTKNDSRSPVIVRKKTLGKESYLYVVNQSPWPTQVTIQFSGPVLNLRNVNGGFFETLVKKESSATLQLSLEPYDLIAGRSDQEDFKISEVKYSFPESLKDELVKQKDRLLAKIRFLKTPTAISSQANSGFESVDPSGKPVSWNLLELESFTATVDRKNAFEGEQMLVLKNGSEKWGWIRSGFLPNRGTGRISLLVALRSDSDSEPTQVRLCIDGNSKGDEFYRFGSFSNTKDSPESARIGKEWKVFAVHFDDVPTDLTKLRVGLDLKGKGTIYVDEVRVFDRWFDAQDKEALSKIVSLAAHNISTGDYLEAHRLMESYWIRFILAYPDKAEPAPERPQQ